jgi:hypothetical protein
MTLLRQLCQFANYVFDILFFFSFFPFGGLLRLITVPIQTGDYEQNSGILQFWIAT